MTPQQAILGMVLAEPDNVATLKERGISEEIFSDSTERELWREIEKLYRSGEQADAMRVAMTVSTDAKILIGKLISSAPVAQKIEVYADEAVAVFQSQKFAVRLNALARMITARRPFEPIEAIFAEISAMSHDAHGVLSIKPSKEKLVDLLLDHSSILEGRIANAEAGILTGISTGYKNIDEEITGLQKGALVVVAARPGIGKTTITLQFALAAAAAGHAVGFFSTEMTQINLVDKILSNKAKVAHKNIKSGAVNANERDAISETYSSISGYRLYIPKTTRFLEAIEAKARLMKAAGELDLLVIENVGQLQVRRTYRSPYERVSAITGDLKELAKNLDIPVVLLCHINREADKSEKAPRLCDLKDSSSIENDGDVVMIIWREHEKNQKDLYLELSKNRYGAEKKLKFCADFSLNRIEEV